MRIAVDFDGTIVEHKYPDIGLPVIGAFVWLRSWQELGAELVLWTCRDGIELDEAVAFCKKNGVEFIGVNGVTDPFTQSPKVFANVYVDDAAFGCPLVQIWGGRPVVDWKIVGPAIEKRLKTSSRYR